ncbi:hypothetical protein F5879DRAFT_247298 [Lentinula edodes]|nr:hypothetical protein F5879DRAFT_247298 [Lentinula edodes]
MITTYCTVVVRSRRRTVLELPQLLLHQLRLILRQQLDGHHVGLPLPNHYFPLPPIVGGNSDLICLTHVSCIPLEFALGIYARSKRCTHTASVIHQIYHHAQLPRLRTIRHSHHLWGNLRAYTYMDSEHGFWAWHQARCTGPNLILVDNELAVQDEVQNSC